MLLSRCGDWSLKTRRWAEEGGGGGGAVARNPLNTTSQAIGHIHLDINMYDWLIFNMNFNYFS